MLDDLNFDYQAQTQLQVHSMLRGLPGGFSSDGGPYGGSSAFYTFNTNGLWLAITNVADGLADLTLNNATNQVYAIWCTTNLLTNWQVAMEVWPTNPVLMPFTLATLNPQNLFIRAEDWTGVTENGNNTPDWWFWEYFGTTDLSDSDRDSQGNTLVSDYYNGIDPNVIVFTLVVTNNYFNFSSVPLQLNIQGGLPEYVAVSVDDTNFAADADWQNFSETNLPVNVGPTQGWHQLWVGLKGRAPNASIAWQWTRVKLMLTPPQLVINGPAHGATTVPVVQLGGYSTEALAAVDFDLSNTAGTVTNRPVSITQASYNPNSAESATNYFQAYDVPLTNGLNVITVHATDLAGNIGTITTNIYCSATNSPVFSLLWPQNGMLISGETFTIHGQVNDPTATVSLTGADTNGNPIQLNGLTGRDGNFWVENVPLTNGQDNLTLTVSNTVACFTTNFTVTESGLSLTIDDVQAGDTAVSGTIGAEGYTIWANGVEAAQDGEGNWSATIMPIGVGGGVVAVVAVPAVSSYPPAPTVNAQATVEAPSGVFVSAYDLNIQSNSKVEYAGGEWADSSWSQIGNWQNGGGATGSDLLYESYNVDSPVADSYVWPPSSWPEALPDGTKTYTSPDGDYTAPCGPPSFLQVHCDTYVVYSDTATDWSVERHTEDMQQTLATGGPLGSTAQNLWYVGWVVWDAVTGQAFPSSQVTWGGLGNMTGESGVYALLRDNSQTLVTPRAAGSSYYAFEPGVQASSITLQSLTVVSNSAVQVGGTNNWAAVMTTTNDWVYVQAGLSLWFQDTNAANFIQWSGAQPVPGNPYLARVSKGTSAETTVTATLGSTSLSLNVWIVWSTISIMTSSNSPSSLSFPFIIPGGDQLGIQYYSNSNAAVGKICGTVTLTPSGVGSIITNGWFCQQNKWNQIFIDGTAADIGTNWVTDTTSQTNVPNGNDKLYFIDAPNIEGNAGTSSLEIYYNFYDYATWNGQTCSCTNNFWHFRSRWKFNQTPQITFIDLGTGSIAIPSNPTYPPP